MRVCVALAAAVMLMAPPALVAADPCGMVPPVFIGDGPAITRVGPQKTYVFWKNGIETFVIRPGFSGRVEDFGMLIPFPAAPSLRKVDDAIFTHIANAIDPPEVVIDLRPVELFAMDAADGGAMPSSGAEGPLRVDEVRVLNREAVGMYEVVVLEAGSAVALNRWMDDHGYTYPEGMDAVCNDYIAQQWCFVAVKTRVGPKDGVDPQPGQRDVDPGLPEGAGFDGNVQAMGFRFPSDELVVPMRLSAFNEGRMRNVVYVLTDTPQRIEQIDAGQVRRQVDGATLLRNVTGPRPLRILGGTVNDLSDARRRRLVEQRKPGPVNGLARELFAFDLLTAATGELGHVHEHREKQLLDISERLMLRGPEIDALHRQALSAEPRTAADEALQLLAGMTLTVIDGDFPREVIADENLRFIDYEMPDAGNVISRYHAPSLGPRGYDPAAGSDSHVHTGPIDEEGTQSPCGCAPGPGSLFLGLGGGAVVLIALVVLATGRRRAA